MPRVVRLPLTGRERLFQRCYTCFLLKCFFGAPLDSSFIDSLTFNFKSLSKGPFTSRIGILGQSLLRNEIQLRACGLCQSRMEAMFPFHPHLQNSCALPQTKMLSQL